MSGKKKKLKEKVITKNKQLKNSNTTKKKSTTKKATPKKKIVNKVVIEKQKEILNAEEIIINTPIEIEKAKKISENPVKEKKLNKEKKESKLTDIFKRIFSEIKEFLIYCKNIIKDHKRLFTMLLIVVALFAVIIAISKNLNGEEIFTYYDEYTIGDKVKLKDDSVWYVVESTDNKASTIKLLSEWPLDINGDGKRDDHDKLQYNKSGGIEYKKDLDDSIYYFLEEEYKPTLKGITGNIEVDLLTSKEYVKLRDYFQFGYEWQEDNFLASQSLGYWWINTNKNDKIYIVNTVGSYVLVSATKSYYVRPVVIIDKSNIID